MSKGLLLERKSIMSLLTQWRENAYNQDMNTQAGQLFWANYFNLEKGVYEQLLAAPDTVVTGTVKELADKYNLDLSIMVGFLDGVNDSLKNPNPVEEMEEDTVVTLDLDLEKLYYNMCEAKADWLYELPAWDNLLTKDRRKELFLTQRKSGTIVKEKKIGRNDPCTCGSGRKYKQCCGR